MKRKLSGICGALVSAALLGSAAPSLAAPLHPTAVYQEQASNVVNVDWRHRGQRIDPRKGIWRNSGRRYHGRHHYGHRYDGRSYRYRHHDNFVGPAAGFVAGALIGSVITNSAPRYNGSSSHVRWCYDHYRSYRASDDTFQPYHGPRRRCNSPYN